MTVDLYRAAPCKVCGKAHDLYFTADTAPPAGAAYAYDCPDTRVSVFFRPGRAPVSVSAAPDGAVPLRWVAN